MTVAETVIGLGLAGIVLVALTTTYMYSTRTLVSIRSMLDLDNANRLAVDRISQVVRQADRLISMSSNRLVFARGAQVVTFNYTPELRLLTCQMGDRSEVLLRNCASLQYEVFQRTPKDGTYEFFPTATASNCKVVRMTWLTLQEHGTLNEKELMRSAQIVLRNQRL